MVGSGVSLDWGWVVWLVVGLTLVLDISNVARVGIGNIVGDDLGAAIGKGNTVRSGGGISITGLVLAKVGTRVLVSDTVLVSIDSWAIIGWFVIRSWLVVSWSWVYDWFVYNWGYIWSWLVYNWCMIWCWSRVINWSNFVNWGGVIDWGWFIGWCWMVWCWVVWGRVSISWSWVSVCWGMMDSMMGWASEGKGEESQQSKSLK